MTRWWSRRPALRMRTLQTRRVCSCLQPSVVGTESVGEFVGQQENPAAALRVGHAQSDARLEHGWCTVDLQIRGTQVAQIGCSAAAGVLAYPCREQLAHIVGRHGYRAVGVHC